MITYFPQTDITASPVEKPLPFQSVYPQTLTFIFFAYRTSKQKVNLQFQLSPQKPAALLVLRQRLPGNSTVNLFPLRCLRTNWCHRLHAGVCDSDGQWAEGNQPYPKVPAVSSHLSSSGVSGCCRGLCLRTHVSPVTQLICTVSSTRPSTLTQEEKLSVNTRQFPQNFALTHMASSKPEVASFRYRARQEVQTTQ